MWNHRPGTPSETILLKAISVFISFATLWLIDQLGLLSYLQEGFDKYNFAQLKAIGKTNTEGITIVVFFILHFVLRYSVFSLIFFELLALPYFLVSSSWRKPRVFISYKMNTAGAKVNTNQIALDIKKHLSEKGFTVLHFQYESLPDHDYLNFQIKKLLKKADAMIAVPDPYFPSYVDAEIACAVNNDKPVYIIKHTIDQKLPATANSGHTVLLLDNLIKENYKPLGHILNYTHQIWYKRLFIIWLPLVTFLLPLQYFNDGEGKLTLGLIILGLFIAGIIYLKVPISTVFLILKFAIVLAQSLSVYLTLIEIYGRVRFEKIIRQSMINAGNTYEYFVEAEFDKRVLYCIDKDGLLK